MASPMPDISESEWREIALLVTRETCPLANDPHATTFCGAVYWVDADGRWVQDCTMAGISSQCGWME